MERHSVESVSEDQSIHPLGEFKINLRKKIRRQNFQGSVKTFPFKSKIIIGTSAINSRKDEIGKRKS